MNPHNEGDLVSANGLTHVGSNARLGIEHQNSYLENSNSLNPG